jgi:outer membrane immunogenic protein
MKCISLSMVAILAGLSIATAVDAQSFDGPFAGVQMGWGQNDVRNPTTNLGVLPLDRSQDSAVFGAYLGYDKSFGSFVLGAETGLSFGAEDSIDGGDATTRVSIDPRRTFDLTARAGYLVTPKALIYARGGYTNERIRTTLTSASGTLISSEDRDGWLIGGGAEYKITDSVSARLEYRYADLSEGDGKYDRHQLLTGISYRF